jgi:hypothetical protein
MPTPPLIFVEPCDAVQQVRSAFNCTDKEAIALLLDAWIAGMIVPHFVGSPPPADYDPRDADWFSGEIVIQTQQQISTIPIGGYRPFERLHREQGGLPPREYRFPKRTLTNRYAFKVERRQLDVILALPSAPVPRPDDPPLVGGDARQLSERKGAIETAGKGIS